MGLAQYLKDTQAELKHVSWPTQKQTVAFTAIVIVMSLVTAAFLGVFDALFAKALEFFVI